MERSDNHVYSLLVNELKTIRGRLTTIEDKLDSVVASNKRRGHARGYYVHKIKCLSVEKQSLLNYIKELEAANKLDLPELQK